jgi:nucleotide-binding universal stress UspA family protein
MTTYPTILVPLDGSPLSESALPLAARLARRDGAAVHLVRVHEAMFAEQIPTGAEWKAWMRDEERQYLGSAADRLHREGIARVTIAIVQAAADKPVDGSPVADAICRSARQVDAAFIVMATHGRTGFSRLWFGSIADAVVRQTPVPVLLVRGSVRGSGQDTDAAPFRRVLIPLDGSPVAERVVKPALAIARGDGAKVIAARVVTPVPIPSPEYAYAGGGGDSAAEFTDRLVQSSQEYLDDFILRTRADYPELDMETKACVDIQPASALLRLAAENEVDLIAMTTHGRGASRLILGSVADKLLRGTSTTLLVTR